LLKATATVRLTPRRPHVAERKPKAAMPEGVAAFVLRPSGKEDRARTAVCGILRGSPAVIVAETWR